MERSSTEPWDPVGAGVLRLPSGRLVRGRGLRRPLPDGPVPTYGGAATDLAGQASIG